MTKESLYESVQSEGDPNMPNDKIGINNRDISGTDISVRDLEEAGPGKLQGKAQ